MKTYKQYNESIRDHMTPKSKAEIEKGKHDIISWIVNKVKSGGGRIITKNMTTGIVPLYKSEFGKNGSDIRHEIKAFCLDGIEVMKIEEDGWIEMLLSEYNVKYTKLTPKLLIELRNVLEDWEYGDMNEGVKDMMTPKSKDEVKRELEELPLNILFTKIFHKGISRDLNFNVFTKEELLDMFGKLEPREQIKVIGSMVRLGFTDSVACFEYLQSRLGYSLWSRLKLTNKPRNVFDFMSSLVVLKKHELVKIFTLILDVVDGIMNVNESVKDLMKPKSEEEIKNALSLMSKDDRHNLLGKKLRTACANNEDDIAEQLLKSGVDPNYNNDSDGHLSIWDPLMYAIAQQNIDCIKLLISYGAKVKSHHLTEAENDNWVRNEQIQTSIIKLLNQHTIKGRIKKFFNYNESVKDLMKPKSEEELMSILPPIASEVKTLLDKNNIEYKVEIEQPLSDAYIEIYFYIGKITYQLSIFRKEERWNNNYRLRAYTSIPHHWERLHVSNDKDDMVNFITNLITIKESVRDKMTGISEDDLLKKLSAHLDDPTGILINAVKNGIVEGVELALSLGADPHWKNDWCFVYSCMKGYVDIVKILIEEGADIHAMNDTASYWATIYGRGTIITMLEDLMTPKEIERKNKNVERMKFETNQRLYNSKKDDKPQGIISLFKSFIRK